MDQAGDGYWTCTADGLDPGTTYKYELDGKDSKPDPASHYQPDGIFGASEIIDHESFKWTDRSWRGLDLKDLVFYELHVGTFTPEGTLKAIVPRIRELAEFGINAVELMPITQFPGVRNWGYDGVFPFALHNSYGRPDDLRVLVNECHNRGVALFVDSVYNHLGPEGNCLNSYGPYFPDTNMGLWGANVNLDGPQNSGVRNYFLENALHWLSHYHIDGIRLDAVLAMHDTSPRHFLLDLNEQVQTFKENVGRKIYVIAESGFNVPIILDPAERGGCKFDAQWLEDFQHALFALITGEREGYYQKYGSINDLSEALTEGYVYIGEGQESKRSPPDASYRWIPTSKLVVFAQNHDQIGNRVQGDRLTQISGIEAAKLAAGIVVLSPYVPLLFMGEEYGETAPFQFFTDYQSKELVDDVRAGRKKEFANFHWANEAPDPQNPETFKRSKLDWQQRYSGQGQKIAAYYHNILRLKKEHPIFHADTDRKIKHITAKTSVLFIHKQYSTTQAAIIANFSKKPVTYTFPLEGGNYAKILDSASFDWAGPGSTLPTLAAKGDDHQIGSFNLAVYFKESTEEKPDG